MSKFGAPRLLSRRSMQPVTVLFGPAVDAALVELIDHVDVDSIPTVLDFLERIQTRLVQEGEVRLGTAKVRT